MTLTPWFKKPNKSALAVHVTFKQSGWAIAMLDDVTGTIAVVSDWLDGSYRWNVGALPKQYAGSVTRMFAESAHPQYFTDKLFNKHRTEFDVDGTRKAFREHIIEQRKCKDISADDAREAWDAVAGIEDERDLYMLETPEALYIDCAGDFARHKTTGAFSVMNDDVIPALRAAVVAALVVPTGAELSMEGAQL